MLTDGENGVLPSDVAQLRRQVEKLTKINAVLMDRVERSVDQQSSAFSLFHTAIALEGQVRARTEELTSVLRRLERTNDALGLAKEDAERANRSKTRFLAAASHDLLQPLNAARLSLSMLADMQTASQGQTLAGQAGRALDTIETLIKTLLDISKLDAGVITPEIKPVALNDIFSALAESFAPAAAANGLKLRVRPCRLLIATDATLLLRVLQNLVSNAVRYTRCGGVLVGARCRQDVCHIEVADTGPGIAETERERIFDEFYRGSNGAEDGQAGLGLGLAIVQRMVVTLGARLELHSRPGHGSLFRMIVSCLGPDDTHYAMRRTVRPPAPSGFQEARAFVIENDPTVLGIMMQLFERWGCGAVAARGLKDVDGYIAGGGEPPDIVVADYHLDDGCTGLDAIALLRKRYGAVSAIVVTADHSADTAALIRESGYELVHKPVKPAELRALIAHVLSDAAR